MYATERRLGRAGDRRSTQAQEQPVPGKAIFAFSHRPLGGVNYGFFNY